jgi:hypothetical protein
VGIVILAIAAVSARSVALAGFGLDSLIEIGASTVVVWELSGTGEDRQRRGLRHHRRHPRRGRAAGPDTERRGWMVGADPAAGYVLVYYAAREVREIFAP